jgi:2-iminobutanoate/2-iminopropanoate deaminase
MKRTAIRVDPISTELERLRKDPIHRVMATSETVYVSGWRPFDPESGAKARAGNR